MCIRESPLLRACCCELLCHLYHLLSVLLMTSLYTFSSFYQYYLGGNNLEISDLLNFANRMKKKNKIVIGRLQSPISKEFREFCDDKDHLHTTYDIRKKQLQLEMEMKLKDEFQTRFDMLSDNHDRLWDNIYREFDIDPNGEYSFCRDTGEIVAYTENEESESTFPFNLN